MIRVKRAIIPAVGLGTRMQPVYQEIIRQRGAMGYLIREALFDRGNLRGYLSTSAYLVPNLKECLSVNSVGGGRGQ